MEAVLRIRAGSESNVQRKIATVCEALTYDVETGYSTGDGPCDIYLPNRRVIIETKAPGKADPLATSNNETQFEQCARYVHADHRREQAMLDFDSSSAPWQAFLTDGRRWWHWEYRLDRRGDIVMPDVRAPRSEQHFTNSREASDATQWLHYETEAQVGRPWVPTDPIDLIRPFAADVERLHDQFKHTSATKTKQALWLEMLQASGSAPETTDEDSLFVHHTLLVTIARAVILSLENPDAQSLNYHKAMEDGFVSWLLGFSSLTGSYNRSGEQLVDRIFDEVAKYDWRRRGRDVMRTVYEGLISREHRKAYGEYYTPDWLAEAVVESVLDEPWIASLIKSYQQDGNRKLPPGRGVLDPACGSGTFLFHAAQRIARADCVASQRLSPVQLADFLTGAINGIDIHPVAVEISRATLLRALPAVPSKGAHALQIYQGDSLLWNQSVGFGNLSDEDVPEQRVQRTLDLGELDGFTAYSSHRHEMRLPLDFIKNINFGVNVQRYVEAAVAVEAQTRTDHHMGSGSKPAADDIPRDLLQNLNAEDQAAFVDTFRTLVGVIREEDNGVWAWYFRNAAAPLGLYWRKVDRIVANPPWVRMSHVQVEDRKRDLERLADHLGAWGSGRTKTSLDIAGLFVSRCSDLYLGGAKTTRTGWVLPWAATKGANWEGTRDRHLQHLAEEWDLSKIRKRPFSGSDACVWLLCKPLMTTWSRWALENAEDGERGQISPADSWGDVRQMIDWVDAPAEFEPRASSYLSSRNSRPAFAQGATLVPVGLIEVAEVSAGFAKGRSQIVTAPAPKSKQWKKFGSLQGEIPDTMLHEALTDKSLFAFTVRQELSRFILPLDSTGRLLSDSELAIPFWETIEGIYRDNKGKGKNTPDTLWGQLDYRGKLMKQIKLKHTAKKVVYNASGQHLRSARIDPHILVSKHCYWYLPANDLEGAYLSSLLNAMCLKKAFSQSRTSDRHVDLSPWRGVPIPSFDGNDDNHVKLANLCIEAETIAESVVASEVLPSHGQITATQMIQNQLDHEGILARVDEVVRKILPNHTT